MAIVVQKFGGTSVATSERIMAAARRAIQAKKAGNQVIVVVSARGDTTDELIAMAKEISERPPARELDMLLSTGEQQSIALLAMAVQALGQPAVSFTGAQAGILTDAFHTKARIKSISTSRLLEALQEGKIVIVAGFQGVDEEENITTLGRGGSDTTAVALAAAVGADLCEIYTDVEGVFTTDPNVYSKARKLKKISYEEMLEMASMGAKVLHIRSVEFGMKYHVPILVGSSFTDAPGTLVTREEPEMERVVVSGITYNKNEARITVTDVPDVPGMAYRIFKPIAAHGINVDMIIQGQSGVPGRANISFTVPKPDYEDTIRLAETIAREIGAGPVHGNPHIAKISIIGVGMRSHTGVAGRMFETLARENINIMMISTSEIKISCVIEDKFTELAVRVLHDAFGLEQARK